MARKRFRNFTVGFRVKMFDILPENQIKYPNGDTEIMRDTPLVELLVRGREVKGERELLWNGLRNAQRYKTGTGPTHLIGSTVAL